MSKVHLLGIYPVKSCRGLYPAQVPIKPFGLQSDRQYAVADILTGKALSQRDNPKLAAVSVIPVPAGFSLSAPGMDTITLPLAPQCATTSDAFMWGEAFTAFAQNKNLWKWFSDYLGVTCLLIGLPNHQMRKKEFSERAAGEVAFQDSSPISIISAESLIDLNGRLRSPLHDLHERFRPNILVKGFPPYEEDRWQRIQVGEVIMTIRKKIPRCQMIEINQCSGSVEEGPQILAALHKYRPGPKGPHFGVYACPDTCGRINLFDEVKILA